MANKPVFGVAICPNCHSGQPILWNGNFVWKCLNCHTKFKVKRQKLSMVESVGYKPNREEKVDAEIH